MRNPRRRVSAALVVPLVLGLVAACGGDDDDGGGEGAGNASDEEVTITVSNLPPETEASVREAFLARVAEFEDANPNITIEPQEWEWEVGTFGAQLAGGTLPTTFEIPFTYGQTLIERGQLQDITAEVGELPYADDFNPDVLSQVQDDDGNIYAVPTAVYGLGLHYNRQMFEEAGLDPDDPPESWDEVREYAKEISDATGQAGYAVMTQDSTGGWILTAQTTARGGRVEEGSGDDVEANLDDDATVETLEMLQAMRWEDDSMGDNFLYDWGGINQAFAAGQVGMYLSGSDVYNSLVTENSVDPDSYGLTVVPLDGDDAGVLSGGTIVGVRPDSSEAERAAAVKWIDFFYLSKLTDEDAAVADAEALVASDGPVGTPTLPVFNEEQLAESDGWIADYVNVPLDQMSSFKDNIAGQPVVGEPPVAAQEVYAELDAVVQAVLTDEGADIDSLLATANDNADALVNAG
jgi:ABC-type glycerol-3-phosphate transport system substrate-binding protein